MEQYAGDGTDLESLPTMIILKSLLSNLFLSGLNAYLKDRSEKRQLIRLRIIIVFNYSGISLLGKTSDSLFLLCRFQ